ncbi:hypothetical protein SAMN02910292_03033 [Lachnospiraceae bacterium XBB2008]|nr:hypothetical protein SAMN02910292_03033 [Lachnospiraceae bacterium XBB2008]
MKKEDIRSISDFADTVKETLETRFGSDRKITVNNVLKNNGVELTGIVIKTNGSSIAPTIYLESLYERYLEGVEYEELITEIIEVAEKHLKNDIVDFDIDMFSNWEIAKNRVCYKLVNASMNADLLKEVPHVLYLDLAILFYYTVENTEIGTASILIKNEHLKLWGIAQEELVMRAKENTPLINPVDILPIQEALNGLYSENEGGGTTGMMDIGESLPMYVMSNKNRLFGASTLLYPGIIKDFAVYHDMSLYILPSSIHELILIDSASTSEDEDILRSMVHEINETQVDKEDRLSDNIYYYDLESDTIELAA